MSKRMKISAKKLKNISDPELKRSHKAGAIVEIVQPAVDKKWGRYHFNHGHYRNYLMFSIALLNYKKSIKYLNECRKLPIGKSGTRFVGIKLRDNLEKSSSIFIVFTKLGFEYLTAEYLPTVRQIKNHRNEKFIPSLNNVDLLKKLRILITGLGLPKKIPAEVELLLNRRDILEHPLPERLYNSTESGWKNNHLAWVLSGEFEGSMDKIIKFVNTIVKTMEKYKKNNPIPGELKLEIRGLRAGESFKK